MPDLNNQQSRTMQETRTTLAPAEVLEQAKRFFTRRNNIYSTFLEHEGPTYVGFRGQGGEELVIGVDTVDGSTRVTGSTYMFDMQVSRFLGTLPPAPSVTAQVAAVANAASSNAPPAIVSGANGGSAA